MRATAVILALLLAGCLRVGPGEDLHLVCERERTSPWHPYSPDDLAAVTRVNGTIDAGTLRTILQDVADRLVTPGAAPYETFEASLAQAEEGRWRFVANGTWPGGEDHYDIAWPAGDAPVPATAWLLKEARAAVAQEPTLADAGVPTGATWSRDLPGCVSLAYGEKDVVVNVDKGIVVSVQANGST